MQALSWLDRLATLVRRALTGLSLGLALTQAHAADIAVLVSGAYKPVLLALQPDFERQTGHRLRIQTDTAGALQKRVAAGEPFDLAVITPATIETLHASGKFANGPVPVARVGIGVAVRKGQPAPDISTVAAFQSALLAARSIATVDPAAGGSSGIYLWGWFEKAGIATQLKPKAVLVQGGLAAERLLDGRADLALQQVSELMAVNGASVVGLIPAEIQNYTVYAAAISAQAREPAAAQALLQLLTSPAAGPVLVAKGMLQP